MESIVNMLIGAFKFEMSYEVHNVSGLSSG